VPATTITINREQRDGLYELVRNHLLGDSEESREDAETKRRFRQGYVACEQVLAENRPEDGRVRSIRSQDLGVQGRGKDVRLLPARRGVSPGQRQVRASACRGVAGGTRGGDTWISPQQAPLEHRDHRRLPAKPGDCCVFCSYADTACPPKQAEARLGEGQRDRWSICAAIST
jgi:hypothetical protein